MALSLAGGVAFATLITLILVPALVMVREDLLVEVQWFKQLFVSNEGEDSTSEAVS